MQNKVHIVYSNASIVYCLWEVLMKTMMDNISKYITLLKNVQFEKIFFYINNSIKFDQNGKKSFACK